MKPRLFSIPYWLETLILFKLCWVLLVVGQNSGIAPALVLLALSFSRFPGPRQALKTVLLTALAGISLDIALTQAGLFAFAGTPIPAWLVVLWLAFAHALHNALHVLKGFSIPALALIGAVTGPLSYLFGHLMGAVGFPLALPLTLGMLALCWALLLPLVLRATKVLSAAARLPLTGIVALFLVLPPQPVFSAAAHNQSQAPSLALLGEASMRVFFRTVYDISLYTEHADFVFPSAASYRLELAYRMDIAAAAMLRETRRQWDALGIDAPPEWSATLAAVLPSVSNGDQLALTVAGGRGTLTHNGQLSGRLEDPLLVEAFASIWLAETTTQPQLRRQLLEKAR